MRDNGVELRRLALSRSTLFTDGGQGNYWSTPRAAISSDGSWWCPDSNFGVPRQRPARHPDSNRLSQVNSSVNHGPFEPGRDRDHHVINLPHGGHGGI